MESSVLHQGVGDFLTLLKLYDNEVLMKCFVGVFFFSRTTQEKT